MQLLSANSILTGTSQIKRRPVLQIHTWASAMSAGKPYGRAPAVPEHTCTLTSSDQSCCTPPTRGPSACPAPPRRQSLHGLADIRDHAPPCIGKQAFGNLGQTLSPDPPPASEAADMHRLMVQSSPVSSASELLIRLRQVPVNDQHSSGEQNYHMLFQTAPGFAAPQVPQLWPASNCAMWSAPTANPNPTAHLPILGQLQTETRADVCSREPHTLEIQHAFQAVPQCDYLPHDVQSDQQEQLQFRAAAPVGVANSYGVESVEDLATASGKSC